MVCAVLRGRLISCIQAVAFAWWKSALKLFSIITALMSSLFHRWMYICVCYLLPVQMPFKEVRMFLRNWAFEVHCFSHWQFINFPYTFVLKHSFEKMISKKFLNFRKLLWLFKKINVAQKPVFFKPAMTILGVRKKKWRININLFEVIPLLDCFLHCDKAIHFKLNIWKCWILICLTWGSLSRLLIAFNVLCSELIVVFIAEVPEHCSKLLSSSGELNSCDSNCRRLSSNGGQFESRSSPDEVSEWKKARLWLWF